MIDERLKSGPLPEVVEVSGPGWGWTKRRPVAYDARHEKIIYAIQATEGNESGGYGAAINARPVPPRVPTDEDAKRRPKVRWRYTSHGEWNEGVLRAVIGERFWLVTNGQMECCCHCELIE